MLPAGFLLFLLVLAAHLTDASLLARERAQDAATAHREARLVAFAEAVRDYRRLHLAYPADAATLAATPGFAHTRGLLAPWQGYAVSGELNDGTWRFRRALVHSQDPRRGIADADYRSAANNRCGGEGFATAVEWCGPAADSRWWRDELRAHYPAELAAQRAALNGTLAKLATAYGANGRFPDPGATSLTLASAVGYGGTATTCTGVWPLEGVALDCGDLFDRWGHPVTLNPLGPDALHLVARAPILDAAGAPVRVAAHLVLS